MQKIIDHKILVLGALNLVSMCALAQERPNVIFIMADDLGFGDLECYNGKESTPHINEFARQGCLFTNAYAVASTSTPSRYSFLTGKYSWREKNTGIATGDAGMIISPETFTVADLFSQAGYVTAAFGKWHLGLGSKTGQQTWNTELDQGLTDLGFDDWHIMAATADRVPCVYIRGNSERGGRKINHGRVVNLDPKDPIRVSYTQSLGDSTWFEYPNAVKLAPRAKNDHHGATIVDSIPRIGHMIGGYAARWKDENIADTIVGNAINFIRARATAKEPFFVYMATNDIHVPRWPHDRFRGKSKMGLRGDAIMAFDWSVGKIMEALKELNIDDNTLVIISSDNGPVLDDGYDDRAEPLAQAAGHLISGGLRGGKYTSFEGGTRVPFLVRWPACVPQGKISQAMVSQVDFLGTMADLLHEKVPVGQAMDSQRETASWLGQDLEKGRDYILETTNERKVSVRTRDWKYIHTGELYKMSEAELHDDYTPIYTPVEVTNVASENEAQVRVMKKIIADEVAKAEQIQILEDAEKLLEAVKPSNVIVSELTRVDSLTRVHGLPGTPEGTQIHFKSEKVLLQIPTDIIRLTFTSTNTHPEGQMNPNKAFCPVGLAELQILDEQGEVLPLNVADFTTNNQETTEGPLSGICDGNKDTYWHSTWSEATESKPYLEIKLPKKMTTFQFSYISKHMANVPQSILVSSVKQHTEQVPGLDLPQSYLDTLQYEYDRMSEHFGEPGFVSSLNEIVLQIQTYINYKERLESNDLPVDDVLAETDLAYLTTDELNFIRTTVESVEDFEADGEKFKKIEDFLQPEPGCRYFLLNKKTNMYAGMQSSANSQRKATVTPNDPNFLWEFVYDETTRAYLLCNVNLNKPVCRKDSKETIFAKDRESADRWSVVPRKDKYYNIRIVSSSIASDRDCLNDNGQTVNAYSDEEDLSTSWKIIKVKNAETGIEQVTSGSENNRRSEVSSVYKINGQRVMTTDRGVYIVNGKKIFFSE